MTLLNGESRPMTAVRRESGFQVQALESLANEICGVRSGVRGDGESCLNLCGFSCRNSLCAFGLRAMAFPPGNSEREIPFSEGPSISARSRNEDATIPAVRGAYENSLDFLSRDGGRSGPGV